MIEVRAEGAVRPRHAGREHGDLEAERAQQRREEPVELVAEAAAPPRHDLVEQGLVVEHDRLVGVDAEVLEGDRLEMGDLQGAQGLGRGSQRAAVADPVEVGLNVHGRSLAGGDRKGRDLANIRLEIVGFPTLGRRMRAELDGGVPHLDRRDPHLRRGTSGAMGLFSDPDGDFPISMGGFIPWR